MGMNCIPSAIEYVKGQYVKKCGNHKQFCREVKLLQNWENWSIKEPQLVKTLRGIFYPETDMSDMFHLVSIVYAEIE